MSHKVSFKIIRCCRCIIGLVAMIRFLLVVYLLMPPQFASCNSRISALVAAERLFSGVDLQVGFQRSSATEALIALFTIMLLLSTVGQHMFGKIT